VAEDNPVNQKLASYMLENLGVTVLLAGDGKVAYELLQGEQDAARKVDLVLMDFQMPEWDGLTATRAIRARERDQGQPRLPVLALTANAMAGFERTCLEAGMDDVLIKPLKEDELADALERWLPHRARAREPLKDPDRAGGSHPQPGQADTPPPRQFQVEKIRKLCHENPARIEEMLRLFLTSTEPLLEQLSLAIQMGDSAQAARQAHQIKGAAAYLGAQAMTRHAAATEQRAKAGDLPGCTDDMEELEAAFIALRLEMEEEIKRLAAG
jgi:CheY-like chemotaxis protein/HPt (histidine-containing phosphotransfer) domain-containing protein